MEGTKFAVLLSVGIYTTAYLISLYYLIFIFSNGIIPKKIREKTNKKTLNNFF